MLSATRADSNRKCRPSAPLPSPPYRSLAPPTVVDGAAAGPATSPGESSCRSTRVSGSCERSGRAAVGTTRPLLALSPAPSQGHQPVLRTLRDRAIDPDDSTRSVRIRFEGPPSPPILPLKGTSDRSVGCRQDTVGPQEADKSTRHASSLSPRRVRKRTNNDFEVGAKVGR